MAHIPRWNECLFQGEGFDDLMDRRSCNGLPCRDGSATMMDFFPMKDCFGGK